MILTEEAVQSQVPRSPAERQQFIADREESWMALSWDRNKFSPDDAKTTLTILSAIAFSDYKEPIDLSHLSDEASSSREADSSADLAAQSSTKRHQPHHHPQQRNQDNVNSNNINTNTPAQQPSAKNGKNSTPRKPFNKRKDRKNPPKRQNARQPKTQSIIPEKSIVACLVRSSESPDMWVLGRVERYIPESKQYEVMDHDNDSEEQRYLVKQEDLRVIPPKRLKLDRNKPVLAVYPTTTVFYKAHLREQKRGNCWAVEFEDDYNDSFKEVESRFILQDPGCIS